MQLETYDKMDGRRVRLTQDELDRLLAEYDDRPDRQIALSLMGRCGCRSEEAVDAKPQHVIRGDSGRWFLRIPSGKGSKERQTPIAADLAGMVRAHTADHDDGETILRIKNTRTLRKWVKAAANARRAAEEDERWQYVAPHDLRRTWGHLMLESEVLPSVLMQWGGWEDYETFQKHYLGKHSEKIQNREAGKVAWL